MDKQNEILNILVNDTLISPEQLAELKSAANVTKKNIEELLLERKIISEEELTKVKAKAYNILFFDLKEIKIKETALNTIPIEVSQNYNIICFGKEGNNIKVGMLDPNDFKAIEAVDFLSKESGLHVEYFIISQQSFDIAFKHYKTFKKEISHALENRAEEKAEEAKEKTKKKDDEKIEEITKSAPVAKIVSVIIRHAVEGRASDIHIEPLRKETRVRYRIDGVLHTSLVLPRDVHNAIIARIKVLSNLKLDETRIPQDGRIRLTIDDKDFDFRVSSLPLIGTEKIVMRILDVSKEAPKLEELGFQGVGKDVILKNMKKTEGLLLVTGPTGSGKSTTLFSLINSINREGINISTLEDPVEYQIKGVNQSQAKPDVGYTFASGLRSLLRQDPDVIMVGEIRDKETAELAIHSALTGHYVLSTLHTNDAPSTIIRLTDMGVEPFLLGSTMHTVIGQRLARKNCEHCKTEVKLPKDFLEDMMTQIESLSEDYIKTLIPDFGASKLKFYKGKGCPRCGNSGYIGRMAIAEVLDINEPLKELIVDGHNTLKMEEIQASQNFVNFKQDGYLKVAQGLTTMEEILRVSTK